jgi:hypothetical protein
MTTDTGQTADQQQADLAMRAREARIERLLGRPIPTDQRALVRAALADNDETWTTHELASVPDGTEPAFVFSPTRPPTTIADEPVKEGGHE